MTEFADIEGGRIAYDETGQGPLIVLSHGIGDRRQAYRFLAPRLAQAGYRVAAADLRGHGESSMGWTSVTGKDAISRTDVAGDLVALIRQLGGGPAVIVGHSLSGGAATIAAATRNPARTSSGTRNRKTCRRSPMPCDSTISGPSPVTSYAIRPPSISRNSVMPSSLSY